MLFAWGANIAMQVCQRGRPSWILVQECQAMLPQGLLMESQRSRQNNSRLMRGSLRSKSSKRFPDAQRPSNRRDWWYPTFSRESIQLELNSPSLYHVPTPSAKDRCQINLGTETCVRAPIFESEDSLLAFASGRNCIEYRPEHLGEILHMSA